MALADYRLCDVCGNKAFYDANLNYDVDENGVTTLDHVGAWAVLCVDCAKTHETVVLKRGEMARIVEDTAELLSALELMVAACPNGFSGSIYGNAHVAARAAIAKATKP